MPKAKVFYKPRKKKTPAKTRGKAVMRKVKRKLKLVAFALFAVGISALILTGVSAYKFIKAPFSDAAGVDYNDTDRVWRSDETNLMVLHVKDRSDKSTQIEDLYIANFDGENHRYATYKIPVDEEIEYALNYGKGSLRNVYSVGNQDQDRGLYVLEKTILKQLAIKIDGYIVIDDQGYQNIKDKLGEVDPKDLSAMLRLKNWPKIPSAIKEFRENSITNLKIADLYDIITFIRETSETSSKVTELTKYQLLEANLWDQLWQENQSLSAVKHEAIKVFVANASKDPKVPGLATWGTRIALNSGASILEGDNSFVDFDENTIITDNPELATVAKLVHTLGIKNVVNVKDLNRDENYNPQIFRTPVTLVLVKAL